VGLTEEELDRIAKKEMTIDRLTEVKDVFLFCCYTGYAFIDAQQLTPEHVYITKGNERWIKTTRQKTDIASNVPLLPPALANIERYRIHPYCVANNRLLPIKSNQKMNAYLKEIAVLCNIKCNLTTHIARHTFATTVTLANGVPIESVSKMLGHTKITTTQIYAKVLEGKISADMQHLMAKFKAE
jgi:site-specific recombinase XerD